nr:hypothetical protein B0A51_01302 [Rachicladosporium sp. CCFEE 5018]
MKSGYEAGANIRGTGQKALLVQELDDHVKDKRPYEKALVELERQVVEAFKSFGTVVQAIQQQTIAEITRAVEDLTTKKPATSQKLAAIRAKYPGVQVEDFAIQLKSL